MSTENNDGDQPEQPSSGALDFEALAQDFFSHPDQAPRTGQPEAEAQQEAQPVPASQDQESAEEEPQEEPQKELLSPLLAEKAKTERELRAKLETAHDEAKKELLAELLSDTQGFIQKYEVSEEQAEQLALHWYAATLGDEAPEELRAAIGQSEQDRRYAEMQRQIEQLRSEREQAEVLAQNRAVLDQYQGYIGSLNETQFPYLSAEASHDSGETLRAFAEAADAMYARDGKYPSASEVATLIEETISETAARYTAIHQKKTPAVNQSAPSQPTESVAKPKPQTQTLSNQQSGKSVTRKVPVGEDELLEDALRWMEENDFYKPIR